MLDYCTRISQPARSTACTGGIRVRYLAGNTSLLLWSSMSQMPAFAQHWHCYCNHAYTFELLSFALPSAPHRVHNIATQLCHTGVVVNCCRHQAALHFFVTPSVSARLCAFCCCCFVALFCAVMHPLFSQSKRTGMATPPKAVAGATAAVINANLFACFDFYSRQQRRVAATWICIFFPMTLLFFLSTVVYAIIFLFLSALVFLIFLRRASWCQLLLTTKLVALRKIARYVRVLERPLSSPYLLLLLVLSLVSLIYIVCRLITAKLLWSAFARGQQSI